MTPVEAAIRARRSVKYFDPEHRLSPAQWSRLVEAARHAPTAFNIQNWRLVRVRNPETRARIRAAAWDQPQMTDAALLLVLCFDLRAWDRQPERYWRNAPAEVAAQLVPEIRQFYAADPQLQRDEGQRSCGIVAQTLMLTATAMGLASCALDGFDYRRVAELIHLPEDHAISMILAIGRQRQAPHARPGLLPASELVIDEHFTTSSCRPRASGTARRRSRPDTDSR